MLTIGKQLGGLRSSGLAPKVDSRIFSAFFFAGLVSGMNWYYQRQWASNETDKQKKIIQRVEENEVRHDFTQRFDVSQFEKWEGQKIVLDGIINPGRFIVKRKRGDQEGYLVLAPYTIQKQTFSLLPNAKKIERKILINIGWVPKGSKHLIKDAAESSVIAPNDYSAAVAEARVRTIELGDGLERESGESEFYQPTSTITAYVRRGEKKDVLRGYNNWINRDLFKFIDLPLISKVWCPVNTQEFETVYLDRVLPEDADETVPIPTNKDVILDELNKQIANIERHRHYRTLAGTVSSIAAATLLVVL